MIPGFCTCKRDFPERTDLHPPWNATWHYLCERPVLPADDPPEYDADGEAERIGETFDQAADDYARTERGEM